MFERLIDVILDFLDTINPFVIVYQFNGAVRMRFGIDKGELSPGLHLKIPFADEILSHLKVTTTMCLSEQTITTKDWKQIVTRAVIKYEVKDVKTLLLEVNDAIDAISDMSKGIIRESIIKRDWAECNDLALLSEVNTKIKTEAKKWGIKVHEVTFTDLGEVPSYRLFNSSSIFQQT